MRKTIVIIVALGAVAVAALAFLWAGPLSAALAAIAGILAVVVVWRRVREYDDDDVDLAFLRDLDDRTEEDFRSLLPGAAAPIVSDPTVRRRSTADEERNPLDDLAGLDELDPIAEVERLEAEHGTIPTADDHAFFDDFHELEALLAASEEGLAFEAQMVDEQVASSDDILAASEATALVIDADAETDPEDTSELAKLLAKVQARLAAYD